MGGGTLSKGFHCGKARAGSIPAWAGEPGIPSGHEPAFGRGLSPRGRGTPAIRRRGEHPLAQERVYPRVGGGTLPAPTIPTVDGSIPAWAGEPTISERSIVPPRVYPRVGGGTSRDPVLSVPLVHPSRSIPAWAGEPGESAVRRSSHGPSPRSIPAWAGEPCGSGGRTSSYRDQGLSPRGRGNRVIRSRVLSDLVGSIPAWAGEPIERRRSGKALAGVRVYPRVGGGTVSTNDCDPGLPMHGLSPRGRGNLVANIAAIQEGLPPRGTKHRGLANPVYPRVGGGTRRKDNVGHPTTGLSPRGRGNRTQAERSLIHPPVYPRVGGGTIDMVVTMVVIVGLSPRGRGNLWL